MQKKKVIIVEGPTAVGKTGVAIRLALHFKTVIISADSRQCYKEMNIGVARPSVEELDTVPHYFIATHSVAEEVNAATFENYALNLLNELFLDHDVVIMAGGTGLYIKAFCEGLDNIPEIPAAIRETIVKNYEEKGMHWLQQQVQQADPEFYSSGEIQNPQRLMRALEVVQHAGQSILNFRKGEKKQRNFEIIKIGLELPREILVENINKRVDEMIQHGLVAEVKSLLPYRNLNALNTVGYSEIFEYLDGKLSLPEAVERIKINTRQYAKRQMTWFKKDKEVKWFSPFQYKEIIAAI